MEQHLRWLQGRRHPVEQGAGELRALVSPETSLREQGHAANLRDFDLAFNMRISFLSGVVVVSWYLASSPQLY